MFWLLMEAVS